MRNLLMMRRPSGYRQVRDGSVKLSRDAPTRASRDCRPRAQLPCVCSRQERRTKRRWTQTAPDITDATALAGAVAGARARADAGALAGADAAARARADAAAHPGADCADAATVRDAVGHAHDAPVCNPDDQSIAHSGALARADSLVAAHIAAVIDAHRASVIDAHGSADPITDGAAICNPNDQ